MSNLSAQQKIAHELIKWSFQQDGLASLQFGYNSLLYALEQSFLDLGLQAQCGTRYFKTPSGSEYAATVFIIDDEVFGLYGGIGWDEVGKNLQQQINEGGHLYPSDEGLREIPLADYAANAPIFRKKEIEVVREKLRAFFETQLLEKQTAASPAPIDTPPTARGPRL